MSKSSGHLDLEASAHNESLSEEAKERIIPAGTTIYSNSYCGGTSLNEGKIIVCGTMSDVVSESDAAPLSDNCGSHINTLKVPYMSKRGITMGERNAGG